MREIRSEFIYVLVALFCVHVMSKLPRSITLDKIGLATKRKFGYFTAGFTIQIGAIILITILVDKHRQILPALHAYPKALMFQIFFWCLLIGIAEEVAFRGYVLQVLENQWGSSIALILLSILFGLNHLQNVGETAADVIFVTVIGGIPYAAAYLMTRSLWLSIRLHCGWDVVNFLLFGEEGIPRAVPQTASLVDLESLDAMLQIVLGIIFVLVAVWKGRWIGKNPLAPAKPLASSASTSSPE